MKHGIKLLLLTGLLFFTGSILAAGNGNGSSNGSAGGIGSLEQDITDLQSDVSLLFDLLTGGPQNLLADCSGGNSTALQDAVDLSLSNGSVIAVIGDCGTTIVIGKNNITIDGGGTGSVTADDGGASVAALFIEASNNIQVSNLSVDANGNDNALASWTSSVFVYDSEFSGATGPAVHIYQGSTATIDDLTITGGGTGGILVESTSNVISDGLLTISNPDSVALRVLANNSFNQVSGFVSITGSLNANHHGLITMINGDVQEDGLTNDSLVTFLSRNSTFQGTPGAGSNVSFAGSVQVFSGSNFDFLGEGGTSDIGGTSLLIQRNSATTLFGLNGTTTVDYDSIRITQNSVIDLLSATIPNAPTIRFELGGGGRAFGTIGLPITASCDGSQWLHPFGDISCL